MEGHSFVWFRIGCVEFRRSILHLHGSHDVLCEGDMCSTAGNSCPVLSHNHLIEFDPKVTIKYHAWTLGRLQRSPYQDASGLQDLFTENDLSETSRRSNEKRVEAHGIGHFGYGVELSIADVL